MRYELTDFEWAAISRFCRTSRVAFPVLTTGASSTVSFGSYAPSLARASAETPINGDDFPALQPQDLTT